MDKSGKNENRLLTIVSACDSFTSAYSVMLLLFFLPYVMSRGQWIAAAFIPLFCLLPFAVMPLVYALVHRLDPLLFGRYHLIMPLSALLSALLFVLFFSADGSAAGAVKMAFSFAALSITTVTYRYCSFSVRVRLCGDGIATPTPTALCYAGLGAVSAVVTVVAFYYYDFETALVNGAYIVAAVAVILAMIQYLTTFYHIPKLSGKRVRSVKSVFRTFYVGLNYRTFFSSILTVAAFLTVLALSFCVACFEFVIGIGFGTVGAAVGAFVVTSFFARLIKYRSNKLTAVIISFLIVSALLLAFTWMFMLAHIPEFTVVAGGIAGAGLALSLRQMRLRFLTLKPHITSGVVHILIELGIVAAAAIAFCVALVVGGIAMNDLAYYAYGFGVAAALGIAAVVISRIRRMERVAPKEPSIEPALPGVTVDGDNNN